MNKDPLDERARLQRSRQNELMDAVLAAWGLGFDIVQSSEYTDAELVAAKEFLTRLGYERQPVKATKKAKGGAD